MPSVTKIKARTVVLKIKLQQSVCKSLYISFSSVVVAGTKLFLYCFVLHLRTENLPSGGKKPELTAQMV